MVRLKTVCLLLLSAGAVTVSAAGQQAAASGPPLVVKTTTLPKAFLRQTFRVQLHAEGGIMPWKWQVTDGVLPAGLALSPEGALSGIPAAVGEFPFTVTVTDSGKPGVQRAQALTLKVVSPLSIEWSRYPRVSGQRIDGAIKISNATDEDFDLTVITVAVNQTGRATALGYQRIKLSRNANQFEISFAENLPLGAYDVHVDAIGEVAATDRIYRARLQSKDKLQVRQGP